MASRLTVESVDKDGSIQVSGSNTIRIIPYKVLVSRRVGNADIKPGDTLEVKCSPANAIISISHIPANQKPPENQSRIPQKIPIFYPPPPPPLGNVFESDNAERNNMITNFQLIDVAGLPPQSIASIKVYFDHFRRVPIGANNIILCLVVGIIDYSITYSITEILNKMKSIIVDNYTQMIGESQKVLGYFDKILGIVCSQKDTQSKFLDVQEIYQNFSYDLVLLMRNCIKISTQILFYTSKYREFRQFLDFNDLITASSDPHAQLEPHYLSFILDILDVNLRIIDGNNLSCASLGSGIKYVIHMIQDQSGYNCLYTNEETYLHTANNEECTQIITFMSEINNINNRDTDKEIDNLNIQIADNKKKYKDSVDVFLSLNEMLFGALNVKEVFNNLGIVNVNQEHEQIMDDLKCNKCDRVIRCINLGCGHHFCGEHLIYNSYGYINCDTCDFQTHPNSLPALAGIIF
jgi:hypothetical protein